MYIDIFIYSKKDHILIYIYIIYLTISNVQYIILVCIGIIHMYETLKASSFYLNPVPGD